MIAFFKEFQKIRTANAIIIVSEKKISKNIRIFLNKFRGYVCVFCGFICLKVINFFNNLMTFNLRKTKRQTRATVFLYCNYARVEPIFHDYFHQWITYIVTDWFRFIIIGIPSVVMILEKNLFKIDALFLSFSIILSSSTSVVLSL